MATFIEDNIDKKTFQLNDIETVEFYDNDFMNIKYSILQKNIHDISNTSADTNILFIIIKSGTPKRAVWEECKRNIKLFWDTVPGNFYILFDFSKLSILPPTYIRDWVSLFQYNQNINVNKIPGSMLVITTSILRKALKYYLVQWKPEVPIFVFKKIGSAYKNIINMYNNNISAIENENLITNLDDL